MHTAREDWGPRVKRGVNSQPLSAWDLRVRAVVSEVNTVPMSELSPHRRPELGQGSATHFGGKHQGQQELKSLSDRVRTGRHWGPKTWREVVWESGTQTHSSQLCHGDSWDHQSVLGNGRGSRWHGSGRAPHSSGAGCPRGV